MGIEATQRTRGHVAGNAEDAMAALRARAMEWELAVSETAQGVILDLRGSRVVMRPIGPETETGTETGAGTGLGIEITAPDDRYLRAAQDSVTEALAECGLEIGWDDVAAGALAPGLSIGVAISCRQSAPGFLRLRVGLADASRFASTGLHFRLLIPPRDREPLWPRIGATARVDWPKGADALHRAVYTVADLGADWIDIDIFDHPGSPTCDWARGIVPGAPVGIMGPGGGWLPEGDPLLLFGDETALPAILRILRLSEAPAQAWVTASPGDLAALGADRRVTRIGDLLEALDAADPGPGGFVWFAARDEIAREARRRLTARGLPRERFLAVAYWR
ncbi:SIP domain-containing protein [Rhodovulum sp. YEN HP10]|uniref:SIP domain-containing protein n=1 Tax=Rhodovulum sp. HP10 TaxID=3387397 RepID=UPI0039E14F93